MISQRSLRSYVIAAVLLLGVGLIAITPTAAPLPPLSEVYAPAVELAAVEIVPDLSASSLSAENLLPGVDSDWLGLSDYINNLNTSFTNEITSLNTSFTNEITSLNTSFADATFDMGANNPDSLCNLIADMNAQFMSGITGLNDGFSSLNDGFMGGLTSLDSMFATSLANMNDMFAGLTL